MENCWMCNKEAMFLYEGKWYCYDCFYMPEETFFERMEKNLEDVGDGGY